MATGHVNLQLRLSESLRMGGFGFTATYDADTMHVDEPVVSEALVGYMCAANLRQPGLIRYACASQVAEARSGILATFGVSHVGPPPTAESFVVSQATLVDDQAATVENVKLLVGVVPVEAR